MKSPPPPGIIKKRQTNAHPHEVHQMNAVIWKGGKISRCIKVNCPSSSQGWVGRRSAWQCYPHCYGRRSLRLSFVFILMQFLFLWFKNINISLRWVKIRGHVACFWNSLSINWPEIKLLKWTAFSLRLAILKKRVLKNCESVLCSSGYPKPHYFISSLDFFFQDGFLNHFSYTYVIRVFFDTILPLHSLFH